MNDMFYGGKTTMDIWEQAKTDLLSTNRADECLSFLKFLFDKGFNSVNFPISEDLNKKQGLFTHSLQTYSFAKIFGNKIRLGKKDSTAVITVFHDVGYLGWSFSDKEMSSFKEGIVENKFSTFNFDVPVYLKSILLIKEFVPLTWPEIQAIYINGVVETQGFTLEVRKVFKMNPLAFILCASNWFNMYGTFITDELRDSSKYYATSSTESGRDWLTGMLG